MQRRTIADSVRIEGVDVTTGLASSVTFHPSESSGIVFRRGRHIIPANLDIAYRSRPGKGIFGSAVSLRGDKTVHIVEHLLATPYVLGIDNLEIELSGAVCPTTENCAEEYFHALSSRVVELVEPKRFFELSKGERRGFSLEGRYDSISVSPSDRWELFTSIYFPEYGISYHSCDEEVNISNFRNRMSAKPTFFSGEFIGNIVNASSFPRIHGINKQNYLFVNPSNGYGLANKILDHKMVDNLGTLALMGGQFRNTRFEFEVTGHSFSLETLKKLVNSGSFREVN